jgi:hypothetical protein
VVKSLATFISYDHDFGDPVDEEESHPCCEESGPVVDSNWCFDSHEEGIEFCAS